MQPLVIIVRFLLEWASGRLVRDRVAAARCFPDAAWDGDPYCIRICWFAETEKRAQGLPGVGWNLSWASAIACFGRPELCARLVRDGLPVAIERWRWDSAMIFANRY
jgi:hypothetical protein